MAQTIAVEVDYIQAIGQMRDTIYSHPKKLKGLNYSLRANAYSSEFKRVRNLENDFFGPNEGFMHSSGANGIFYKNLKTKEKLKQLNFVGENYIVKYPMNEFNWIITKEKKYINKFQCFKAYYTETFFSDLLKKEVTVVTTAWFTTDIPLPFGPKGCDGLPGLVLEVSYYNDSVFFIAENIKTYSSDKLIDFSITRPTKGEEITSENFIILMREIVEKGKAN